MATANASEPRGRFTPLQRVELGLLEESILDGMARAPKPRTTDNGMTLVLSEEDADRPERREANARHLAHYVAAVKYVVSEGLTGDEYAQAMFEFTWAGQAYWIWRAREDHLAADFDNFGAAVLRAAGFGREGTE